MCTIEQTAAIDAATIGTARVAMNERSWMAADGVLAEEGFRAYRHLAVRVLALAFLDVANPDGVPADRESARAFLRGSRMLLHWCRVAALDPASVIKVADQLRAGVRSARR